jgi:hypothetical protein
VEVAAQGSLLAREWIEGEGLCDRRVDAEQPCLDPRAELKVCAAGRSEDDPMSPCAEQLAASPRDRARATPRPARRFRRDDQVDRVAARSRRLLERPP